MQRICTIVIFCISLCKAATFERANPTLPPQDAIDGATNAIKALYEANELIFPTVLRLAFHDCVGDRCDGCINHNNPDNAGLVDVTVALATAGKGFVPDKMSRADFWQLAAKLAIEEGLKRTNDFWCGSGKGHEIHRCYNMINNVVKMSYGRQDCSDDGHTTENHFVPNPHLTADETFKFFEDTYGLNRAEVVALMGAHTFGRARKEVSGYEGPWVGGTLLQQKFNKPERMFNNEFYYNLNRQGRLAYDNRPNDPTNTTDKKFQWDRINPEGRHKGMMLNTDMHMNYKIDVDPLKPSSCRIGDFPVSKFINNPRTQAQPKERCPPIGIKTIPGETGEYNKRGVALAFRRDGRLWLKHFFLVWDKVASHGYDNLAVDPSTLPN